MATVIVHAFTPTIGAPVTGRGWPDWRNGVLAAPFSAAAGIGRRDALPPLFRRRRRLDDAVGDAVEHFEAMRHHHARRVIGGDGDQDHRRDDGGEGKHRPPDPSRYGRSEETAAHLEETHE